MKILGYVLFIVSSTISTKAFINTNKEVAGEKPKKTTAQHIAFFVVGFILMIVSFYLMDW
ncbi:hypothetical protein ACFQZX_05100 [Mucilaginibacter litoreus]|uniref:Mid2-like cell wall stress sensor domain protein n=1 Tax=Mucilaginibacter litoreus TaxID=1048221 RepID=A0ABW3APN9_9SPHI